MTERRRLVDTSVLLRSHQPEVFERLQALEAENKLWTCRMVDLQYVYSRRGRDVAATVRERHALPTAAITPETMDRSLEIMGLLASKGRHRHAKDTDCIIAAAAEMHGLSLLHYDRDFDYIAEVTNLSTEWIAPPGSLDRSRKGDAN
jgi:predicted nucleic acid-binding protein